MNRFLSDDIVPDSTVLTIKKSDLEEIMKKLITWILALMMVFALAACATPAATTQSDAAPADVTTAPADAAEAPAADTTAEVKNFKVGVSIMELTAYTCIRASLMAATSGWRKTARKTA